MIDLDKEIKETVTKIYPLDKILPVQTVYRIFLEEYNKADKKSIFLDNRKYGKLREGYFSLFVAVTMTKWSGDEHFLYFPSSHDRDVDIIQLKVNNKEGKKWLCDIKEFTEHSGSFGEFIDRNIKKRIGQYFCIIALHRKVEPSEFDPLLSLLKKGNSMAWVVSNSDEDNDNPHLAKVITINCNNKNYFLDEVDLSKDIVFDKNDPLVIFHNTVKDKYIDTNLE